jgi:hypothetical protein
MFWLSNGLPGVPVFRTEGQLRNFFSNHRKKLKLDEVLMETFSFKRFKV